MSMKYCAMKAITKECNSGNQTPGISLIDWDASNQWQENAIFQSCQLKMG